jgi:chromosome partitioning protein
MRPEMDSIRPAKARTIAVLSQKGGTGKTTLVRSLTHVLRRIGFDVLPIDLDPQGNLSDYFDVPADASPTIREVLGGEARVAEAIHRGVIPADLGLAETELALGGRIGREVQLKQAVREARCDYDFILLDCPPTLGLLTVNALVAASHALITSEAEYFSLRGVEQVLHVMALARESLNPELEWLGVVLNMTDLRVLHARDALRALKESFGDKVFDTIIRRSVRYPESAQRGISILDYKPELGDDYVRLADELLARLGERRTHDGGGELRHLAA